MYFKPKDIKIGILGGGQLAKMIHQESMSLDISIHFMDDSLVCPVAKVSPNFTLGNIQNFEDVYNFGKDKEIVSIEIENVNIAALKALESIGIQVSPKPEILEMIQDKGLQKEFLIQNNFPTSPFTFSSSIVELKESILQGKLKYPFVQKLRKGGYDGRGVCVVKGEEDLFKLLEGESIIEELAFIEQEISVIAVRSIHGECKTYPSVSMVFHPEANLVEYLICPSEISIEKEVIAQKLAMEVANSMNIQGLLAVEMFLNTDGSIWINEVAPRPHNSGHHTLHNGAISQFSNHIRSISGLPLGSTSGTSPSLMLNLLGEEDYLGRPIYVGIEKILGLSGVHLYLYGKEKTKPYRKMGHLCIIAHTIEECKNIAEIVKKEFKIIS